ncbi:MAG: D-2-hydroxyacid dehydrogenase family protein [Chloroflexi bacterium]|nr:D-2-hydroxyacid dehydrogenase family protein [Chloroflexota bacterium]
MGVKLVIPDDYNDQYSSSPVVTQLRGRCDITIHTGMIRSVDDVVARLADAEIVVANRERTPLSAEVFTRVPTLKLIAQTGMRGAHLDVTAATVHGILIAGTGGAKNARSSPYAAASTVELTIGLMLAASRRIPYGDAEVRAGRWSQFVGRELAGRTLGVVGLGRIGGRVAQIARAIGMNVVAWSPNLTPERAAAANVTAMELDAMMSEVDVLSIHLQLSPMSRGLITRERLAMMRPSALLVNTARGPIVDETALLERLQTGRLWGAALDVFGQEPLPADHPLFSLPNVVLTPHVGWVAEDSYMAFFEGIVENVTAYLDGQPIPRMVNPEVLEARSSG